LHAAVEIGLGQLNLGDPHTIESARGRAAGDAQFVADTYTSVFGHAGSSAQVQHFIDQFNFLEGLYTASGVFGSPANVDLLARGGIYGQMLGVHAELDPFGPGGAAGTVPVIGVAPDMATHGVGS